MKDVSFIGFVLEDDDRLADMQRYLDGIEEEVHQEMMNRWSTFVTTHKTMFLIPSSLNCSRKFAGDEQEAIYMDFMDLFISERPSWFTAENIPLVRCRSSIVNRW